MKSNKPIFFLFTCIKDGNEYVDRLFSSLLSQTKVNFVHFIYEDGSTTPLGNKIIEYRNKAKNLPTPFEVIYEYNPINIGLNMSTQYCISKSNCPFFIWIDCDNWVDEHFFEELERTYKKHKNSIILRTTLFGSNNEPRKFNCGSIKEARQKNQLGLFIRKRYYYSFFAVNTKHYFSVNPKSTMLDIRKFYNDDQVLLLCLLYMDNAVISEKAKGYFITRNDQESSQGDLSSDKLKECQLKLCESVKENLKNKLEGIYKIKDLYEKLSLTISQDSKESLKTIKEIKKISNLNKINLNMFYDSNLLKYKLKVYYWKLKRKWMN